MIRQAVVMVMLAAAGAVTASESDGPMPVENDDAAARAAQQATQALAQQLDVAAETLKIESTQPHTWSDSSMGCGTPGTMAMQVITDGYIVTLSAADRRYRVHVSGSTAIVCSKPLLQREAKRPMTNARGLDLMIAKARTDLIQRVGADPQKIRLLGTQPQRWDDNGLGCPRTDEEIRAQPVNGYRLTFSYRSRVYTYHTDMNDVRACPPIEKD